MPDTHWWIGKWDGRPGYANPHLANQADSQFGREVKPIIAEEVSDESANQIYTPEKVDVLTATHIASSDTKKLVVYVRVYATTWRLENKETIRANIIRRLKEKLRLPADEECVALTFDWVGEGDWGKG